jgi:hypothetical protein
MSTRLQFSWCDSPSHPLPGATRGRPGKPCFVPTSKQKADDAVALLLGIAAGDVTEDAVARWLRERLDPAE